MSEFETFTPSRFAGEPALEDMISDPIVQAMMRVDGLREADLRRVLSLAAAKPHRPDRRADAA